MGRERPHQENDSYERASLLCGGVFSGVKGRGFQGSGLLGAFAAVDRRAPKRSRISAALPMVRWIV